MPDGSLRLAVRVQPKASRNQVDGLHGEALKLRVTAPPVDGKANEAVIRFVAKLLGVAPSTISIASGETSRDKVIRLPSLSFEQAATTLRDSLRD